MVTSKDTHATNRSTIRERAIGSAEGSGRLSLRHCAILAASASVLLVFASESFGRRWQEGIQGNLGGMAYRYYLPAGYDESMEYPLVLYLHGSGESGTDNAEQVRSHIGGLINKTEHAYPAILLAPQLPVSRGWGPFQDIDHTNEILDELVDTLSVDRNRIYLTGLSMGGFGAMEYAQHYNAENFGDIRFAAVAPLSGASLDTSLPNVPEGLRDTPIWLIHGALDSAVSVETSRGVFRTLAGLDPAEPILFTIQGLLYSTARTAVFEPVRYTELPFSGHNIWGNIYLNDPLYDWMFAQSLPIVVPEPSSLALAFLVLLAGCVAWRRRKRKASGDCFQDCCRTPAEMAAEVDRVRRAEQEVVLGRVLA